MDNINMSEAEYEALYNRIKQDLYDEFLNPETATYGADVLRQKEDKENVYLDENLRTVTEKEIIWNEINELTVVMKKYEDDEEYEHAAFMKKRIENLKKRL